MPDQPRLFVLMVQACFSSTGASNNFLDCRKRVAVSERAFCENLAVREPYQRKCPIDAALGDVSSEIFYVNEAVLLGGVDQLLGHDILVSGYVDNGDVCCGSHCEMMGLDFLYFPLQIDGIAVQRETSAMERITDTPYCLVIRCISSFRQVLLSYMDLQDSPRRYRWRRSGIAAITAIGRQALGHPAIRAYSMLSALRVSMAGLLAAWELPRYEIWAATAQGRISDMEFMSHLMTAPALQRCSNT